MLIAVRHSSLGGRHVNTCSFLLPVSSERRDPSACGCAVLSPPGDEVSPQLRRQEQVSHGRRHARQPSQRRECSYTTIDGDTRDITQRLLSAFSGTTHVMFLHKCLYQQIILLLVTPSPTVSLTNMTILQIALGMMSMYTKG